MSGKCTTLRIPKWILRQNKTPPVPSRDSHLPPDRNAFRTHSPRPQNYLKMSQTLRKLPFPIKRYQHRTWKIVWEFRSNPHCSSVTLFLIFAKLECTMKCFKIPQSKKLLLEGWMNIFPVWNDFMSGIVDLLRLKPHEHQFFLGLYWCDNILLFNLPFQRTNAKVTRTFKFMTKGCSCVSIQNNWTSQNGSFH